METIVASVERTGRALVVHEAVRTAGAGAEIAARIQEAAFFALDAPVWRLGALDTPIPQDPDLEQLVHPQRRADRGRRPRAAWRSRRRDQRRRPRRRPGLEAVL